MNNERNFFLFGQFQAVDLKQRTIPIIWLLNGHWLLFCSLAWGT